MKCVGLLLIYETTYLHIFAVVMMKAGKRYLLPSPRSWIRISSVRREFTLPNPDRTARTILSNAASLTQQGLNVVTKYDFQQVSINPKLNTQQS